MSAAFGRLRDSEEGGTGLASTKCRVIGSPPQDRGANGIRISGLEPEIGVEGRPATTVLEDTALDHLMYG